MSRARGIVATLRSATAIAVGAIVVHQLRYVVAYGGGASEALHAQGHAYLDALLPVLALLSGLTVVGTVACGLAGVRSPTAHRAPAVTALLYAGAILVAFGTQEVLEGILFAGHPAGLAAVLANGGFVAIPLALAAGWGALTAVRGLERAERRIAAPGHARRPGPARSRPRPIDRLAPSLATLPGAIGARAPPLCLG